MARSLSSVRLDNHASSAFVLFIEGISDAWTTDTSGALTGSGLGSWIYDSEVAIGGREIPGSRRVRPGLIVPETITFGLDLKSGSILPAPCSFQLLDTDDYLATLFATEGHVTEILGERIAPGITDLGSSVATIGGSGTTDPRGRWIGIEKIGPDGERRQWPAIPFDLVGYEHAVHGSLESRRLPPVLISDVPIEFVGRHASLYRIYRDPSEPDTWFTWDEAEAAGDLVWFGILRDAGSVGANKIWSLDCHGPEALLKRTLGTRSPSGWTRISAELTLAPEESYVAIGFAAKGGSDEFFDGSIFDHQITATNRAELIAELNGWIANALDGTDTNVPMPGGAFDTWVDPAGDPPPNPDCGIAGNGDIFVQRARPGLGEDISQYAAMTLAMNSRAWRCLGFEPETQNQASTTFANLIAANFRTLTAGEDFSYGLGTGVEIPGQGYISAELTSVRCGYPTDDVEAYANGTGGPRLWKPVHTSEVFVLSRYGGQVVRLTDEEPSALYLEGLSSVGWSALASIEGSSTDHARFFALRGEVVLLDDDASTEEVEVTDAEEIHQVVLASWVQGASYGTVSEGTGVDPAIFVERFENPRCYGLNTDTIDHDWSGKRAGKGGIELAPLNVYRYFSPLGEKPWEQADTLLVQILTSTGACAGYDAAVDDGGEIIAGPNTHSLAVEFAGDYEIADMGLGVPYQRVQHPSEIREAFATLPGGWDGDLCRLRLAYIGPFESLDVLDSITRPRLLCWSLRDKQLGLFRLEPISPEDVDLVITEADLYGTPGDPESCVPGQNLRATGQLDGVRLTYRWNPADGNTAENFNVRALDAGASRRTGELVEEVTDHGLLAHWFGEHQEAATGIVDWRGHFRQLWERDAPEFFARRHFSATLTLARHLGQDAMPGCSVRLTNPWLVNPSGGYGVAGMTGRVIGATHNLADDSTTVELIIFATPTVRHYAPYVRVSGVTGTTVSWYADNLGHGGPSLDGHGLAEPIWSDAGGSLVASLYQRDGDTWALVDSDTVVSIDLVARTLVLATGFTAWLRDKDHYLAIGDITSQGAGDWPTAVYATIADTDLTIGDGTTPASKFIG
jgi:hypothetical protein